MRELSFPIFSIAIHNCYLNYINRYQGSVREGIAGRGKGRVPLRGGLPLCLIAEELNNKLTRVGFRELSDSEKVSRV